MNKINSMKPCPFCNSESLRFSKNIDIISGKLTTTIIYVECLDCGAEGPHSTYGYDPIEGWNLR